MKILRYAPLATALLLAGCGSMSSDTTVFEDRKYEYKKEASIGRDLEVPPDLTKTRIGDTLALPGGTSADSRSYSAFDDSERARTAVAAAGRVLPAIDGIEVQRDGDQRWLVISQPASKVWPKVVSFWQENGILLVEQNPVLGVMSTDWIENRADIATDFITDKVRQVLDGMYSAATRDQYRVRLEETPSGGTELFLTHRGVVQEFVTGTTSEREQGVWQPRETDHHAEAEMLRRLMVYMGVAEQQVASQLARGADIPARSKMVKGQDGLSLTINEDLRRSWRLLGVALDRVGFLVEDRKQDEGYYLVRYDDPLKGQQKKGILSKLAFWSDDGDEEDSLYRIRLEETASGSQVRVGNEQGKALSSRTAERILTLIHEQIE